MKDSVRLPNGRRVDYPTDWARPHSPGWDPMTGRCTTCDCRYCGRSCQMVPGNVYVTGAGWMPVADAERVLHLEAGTL